LESELAFAQGLTLWPPKLDVPVTLEDFMKYFRLDHPPDRLILCNHPNCEGIADYFEVNEHGGEYLACAAHTSSEKHVSVLPNGVPNSARYESRPAASLPGLETEKSKAGVICSICDKQVTLQEDTCLDEKGKTVHTDCHGRQILQDNSAASGTAA
jgi:hypothetical protein